MSEIRVSHGKLQECKELASEGRSYFGYCGDLFVCDAKSKLYGGFLLMRKVTEEELKPAVKSGTATPNPEADSHSLVSEVSAVQGICADRKQSRSVLALIPSKKRSLMILKSAEKDVICRVGGDLLVRFKTRREFASLKKAPKQSDFELEETSLAKKLIAVLQQLREKHADLRKTWAPDSTSTQEQSAPAASSTQGESAPAASSTQEQSAPAASSTQEQSAPAPSSTLEESPTCTQEKQSVCETAPEEEQMQTGTGVQEEQAGFDESTGQTWVTIGQVTANFVVQDENEKEEDQEEEERPEQEEEGNIEGGEEPPAKRPRLQGHRLPVPQAIRLPTSFYTWSRSRQIVHVCLERIRINEPVRYKALIDRASLRSKISRRRKSLLNLRTEVADLEEDLIKARGTKQAGFVSNLKRRIRKKKQTVKEYERDVAEYEKTRKRKSEAKQYKTGARTLSESCSDDDASSSEFSEMEMEEVLPVENDSHQTRKLKQKVRRLGALNMSNGKAIMGLRSARDQAADGVRVELGRKILALEVDLENERQKRRVAEALSDAVKKAFSNVKAEAQVFEILAGVSMRVRDAKEALRGEVESAAAAARIEEQEAAAKRAKEAHLAHLHRETQLCDSIAALRRDLKIERAEFSELCRANERIYDMLKFPNSGGKTEAMIWKPLLAQRARAVNGFHFDPPPEHDIKWEDEFSSEDYDSDCLHDHAYGDSTTDGTTTEDEVTDEEEEEQEPEQYEGDTEEYEVDTEEEGTAMEEEEAEEEEGGEQEEEEDNTNQNANPDDEEQQPKLHCRADGVEHPLEGRSIAADISLKRYSEAFPYCSIVKKEMRDFIVKDNASEDHQAYTQAEKDMTEHIMWQDISSLAYKYEDRADIGPDFKPVRRSYDEAKQQREKVQARRVELITLNGPLVRDFQAEEEQRKADADSPAECEKKRTEKKELEEVEMKNRGLTQTKAKLTDEEREAKVADYQRFMSGARAVVEQCSTQEVEEARKRVGDFMDQEFPEYVPLKYHLFNFERRNIMKQYSKTTPQGELSKYNLYTGGGADGGEVFKVARAEGLICVCEGGGAVERGGRLELGLELQFVVILCVFS